VRPRPALNLRKVTLTDGFTELALNQPRHLQLRQFAVEPAQGSFHLAQVPKFFTEFHIAICNYSIAICD